MSHQGRTRFLGESICGVEDRSCSYFSPSYNAFMINRTRNDVGHARHKHIPHSCNHFHSSSALDLKMTLLALYILINNSYSYVKWCDGIQDESLSKSLDIPTT